MEQPAIVDVTDRTRVLRLPARLPRTDRPADAVDDLCFTQDLVEAMINAYSRAGDVVVDPFAGYGTTVITAERLGRIGVGFEIDAERVAYARSRLRDSDAVREQDVRVVDWSTLPRFALSVTSPPYMTRTDHDQNPLSGYRTLDGDYQQYLRDLQDIYRGLAGRAAGPDTKIVVNVANLRCTPLAWDVGSALSEVLSFEREIVIDWDEPQDWFTQDYLMLFRPVR